MHFYRKCWFDPFEEQFISPFLSYCPSLMLGIAIHCIQHSQAMLERGVCELAHSFFHCQCIWLFVRVPSKWLVFAQHFRNGKNPKMFLTVSTSEIISRVINRRCWIQYRYELCDTKTKQIKHWQLYLKVYYYVHIEQDDVAQSTDMF